MDQNHLDLPGPWPPHRFGIAILGLSLPSVVVVGSLCLDYLKRFHVDCWQHVSLPSCGKLVEVKRIGIEG